MRQLISCRLKSECILANNCTVVGSGRKTEMSKSDVKRINMTKENMLNVDLSTSANL